MPAAAGNTSASASWNGAELVKVTNWCTVRTAADSAGDAIAQPTFQPVTLKVLPMLPMVMVRSAISGSVAIGTCAAPSNRISQYTSSLITSTSWRRQSTAMVSSSARENTLPVGLWGVFRISARVRGPNAAASRSGSKRQSGGASGTSRTTPPAIATSGA